jgi:hypothetical protein
MWARGPISFPPIFDQRDTKSYRFWLFTAFRMTYPSSNSGAELDLSQRTSTNVSAKIRKSSLGPVSRTSSKIKDAVVERVLFRLARFCCIHLESPRRLGSRDPLRSSLRCGACVVTRSLRLLVGSRELCSRERPGTPRRRPVGTERGASLEEDGRRKHASEAPDSSEAGLSRWSQFHRLI